MKRAIAFLLFCFGLSAQPFLLNDPAFMASTRPKASSSGFTFDPTTIPGIKYWWHSSDLPMYATTQNWTDRVSSVVFTVANTSNVPTNTPLGLWFKSPYPNLTNSGLTLPTNFSFWASVGIPVTQGSDAALLMDINRNDGFGFRNSSPQFQYYIGGSRTIYSAAITAGYPISGGLPLAQWQEVWANGTTYTNGYSNPTNTPVPSSPQTLYQMANCTGGGPFEGYISDIAIFTNTTMAATNVLNLWTWSHTNDCTNVTSGLLAWWKMDENTGTNIADASGNGLNGWTTASTNWTTGQINSGIAFDGQIFTNATWNGSQYVFIPNSTNTANSGALSISLWFKSSFTTAASDPKVMVSKVAKDAIVNDTRFPGWQVHYDDGAISTYFADGVNYVWGQYVSSVSDQQWHHYVATLDSTGTNLLQYLDGVFQVNGYINQPSVAPVYASTNNIMMGYNFDNSTVPSPRYFPGSLDDVRIFNKALTYQEVVSLYKWSYWSKVY